MKTQQPDWLNKKEYPFESKFISQNGIQQHYIDEGRGETLVFVHGTPSWSFDFRKIINEMRKTHRCVALDHVGFGLSEKPADYNYSLENHIKNLTNLIAHLNLKNITLVVHDFGGPIGLEYALQNPQNIKRLIILNTWIGNSENEPEFKKLRRILRSPLLPFLYLRLNFSVRFLFPASFGEKKPAKEIRTQFTSPFPDKNSRYGMLAFAGSLLNDQSFFESQLQRISDIASKKTLLLWGTKDKFVGENYLKKFEEHFTNSIAHRLETTGHFPQEEQPEIIINLIRNFLEA